MLAEADVSTGQCKKTAGKFSLHLRILQTWIPQVVSVPISHQHAFFKNTPLVCLEWISVTWTCLPTFPLPACRAQGLPGAGGRLEGGRAEHLDQLHPASAGRLWWGQDSWRTLQKLVPMPFSSQAKQQLQPGHPEHLLHPCGGRLQSWRCSRPVGN